MNRARRLKPEPETPKLKPYIIRGGLEGRERLRVLARVMQAPTRALLERAGVRAGMRCLDLGCGGGDSSLELARVVGPRGDVVGIDLDEVKLGVAREEAADLGFANVEFRQGDALAAEAPAPEYDVVFARFLLTHLRDPERAVDKMRDLLVPGGHLIVADIDCGAHFIEPPSRAHADFADLYRRAAEARGAHPDIGRRLPAMLEAAGLAPAQTHIVQPAGLRGDVKLLNGLTMEAIADAVVESGLATRERTYEIIDELYRLAGDETVLMSMPRVVEAWARKPV